MAESHPNARLEAFCDAVFAIALTLLVIDIRLPPGDAIDSTAQFWRALVRIAPAVLTFALSFAIIFISWVNHHAAFRLMNKSSPAFIYANGVLMLTVVILPFPTSLLGEHLFTDHAAPAVVLYEVVLACQALGWILLGSTALANGLVKSAHAESVVRTNRRYGVFALVLYSLCAVLALWIPVAIAVVTYMIWALWLVLGVKMKHE